MPGFDLTVDEIFANRNEFISQARKFQNPDHLGHSGVGGILGHGINFTDAPQAGDRTLAHLHGGPHGRPMPYSFYRDMFRGGPSATEWIQKYEQETEPSWDARRKRLFPVNYTAKVVGKLTQSEYGRPLVFEFKDDKRPEEAFYDALVEAVSLNSVRIHQARQRAIDGHSIIQILWDKNEMRPDGKMGQIKLKKVLPEHWFPVYGDSIDEIEAVIIQRHRRMFRREQKRFDDVMITEVYTPHEIGVWEANERLAQEGQQVDLGFLPFVLWQGPRLTGFPLGDSLARSAAELNHAINLIANNIMEMIRYQGFSLLVIRGEAGGIEIDPKTDRATLRLSERAWLNVIGERNAGASFETPNPKISESLDVLDKWTRYMFETSDIPLVAVSPQQGHVESGVSRQISFTPLVDKINELWTEDEAVERKLFRDIIRTHNAFQTNQGAHLDPMVVFTIKEPQGAVMPVDETTKLSNVILAQDHGYVTKGDAIARLNPFLTRREVDAKLIELEAEAKENQEAEADKITMFMDGKNKLTEKKEA